MCHRTAVCVLILLYVCPHTAMYYIYVLILLSMCPHTATHVSSFCYILVLIAGHFFFSCAAGVLFAAALDVGGWIGMQQRFVPRRRQLPSPPHTRPEGLRLSFSISLSLSLSALSLSLPFHSLLFTYSTSLFLTGFL